MGLRILFVSLVCVCLLTSPALASVAVVRALANTAVSKVSLIGAGVATGAAAAIGAKKALAGLAVKSVAVKGGAILTGAVAALGAKAALKGAVLAKGVAAAKTAVLGAAAAKVGSALVVKTSVLPKIPSLFSILSGIWSGVQRKTAVVGNVLDKLAGQEKMVLRGSPVLYEYITQPRYYETVPIVEEIIL